MSSALQSELTTLRLNNYVTLVILTSVGYDYALTFSKEIEHVWSKPWTWVSTLFILVRYFGLYHLAISSLVGSSFLPAPAEVCKTIIAVRGWAFLLFLGAADFVMILRVWAMYARSRLIFSVLLTTLSLEIISLACNAAIQSDPRALTAVTVQILDFSVCFVDPTSYIWWQVSSILQIVHGAVMCIIAIVKFARESLEMYRATKQWQLSRYMGLLVKQSFFYFLVNLLFSLVNILFTLGAITSGGWQLAVFALLQYVPMFTLTPRFIMSVRELHARNVQGSRGAWIDTGFGLSSPSRGAGGMEIVFADAERIEGPEDVEEMPMEVWRIRPE